MSARSAACLLLGALALASTGHAGLKLFDDGTGTRQVLAEGGSTYILKDSGHIWRNRDGRFERIDDGSGTRQITAGGDTLYLLKDSGKVFRHQMGRWTAIDDGTQTRMISAGRGRLFLLKDTGNIFRYDGSRWDRIDDGAGTKQIHAAGATLWILKENGNLWRYDDNTRRFDKIDPGTATRTIVGDETSCYILKDSGELWAYRHGDFQRLGMDPGYRQLAMEFGRLYVQRDAGGDGDVHMFDLNWNNRSSILGPPRQRIRQISAGNDTLYMLVESGNIFSWTASPWAPAAAQSSRFDSLHHGGK